MLTELLNVVPYALSLAALSALLLWALPMLCIAAAPHVRRGWKSACRSTLDKPGDHGSDVWPRFSDPA